MKNKYVSEIFYEIADLLDIKGDSFFKIRAYRLAAQKIEGLDEDIANIVREDRISEIQGVGEALAKKIKEIVETDKLEYLTKLKQEIPESLLLMMEIPSLGPKKISRLYNDLGIKTVEELKKACEQGGLRNLDGFGELTERNILRGIKLMEKTSGRFLLNIAFVDGEKYLDYLRGCKNVENISIAGSLRRMKETIGDLDILVSTDKPESVTSYFTKYNDIQRVLLSGSTKTSVLLNDNLQVDLRVIQPKSYGSALQYFTGSKEHNVRMRNLAIKKGYKLNEYGLFDKKNNEYITGETEVQIYKKLGLSFIPPELRENRGEIEKAQKKKLPVLIKKDDIQGDLHIHSVYSDGSENIDTLAKKAKKMGYKYIGITDHSQSLRIAGGLNEKMLVKKKKEIDQINKKNDDIHVLFGTECDIKKDGSLDYSNHVLKKFDYVGVGIHLGFKMSEQDMTKRILRGMENQYVNFLAHPTGRLIGHREAFKLDIEKVFDKARETNTYLEINAFPDRLDLNDIYVKSAKEKGVKFIIGTDTHSIRHMDYIRFGVAVARRGWCEKKDVVNTYGLDKLLKIFG